MQFLYYRPGQARQVTLDDVQRWGLGYAFDRKPHSAPCMNRTPDGGSGYVFQHQADGEVPQMNIDKQTWRKMPGERLGAPVYVGVWNEAKPGPGELAKPGLPGYVIRLLDGSEWAIPLVRHYRDDKHSVCLPKLMDFDEEGNPTSGEVVAQYRHLVELTQPVVDDLLAVYGLGPEQEKTLTRQQTAKIAIELLSVNYRVSIAELALLEVIPDDSTVDAICASACDWLELETRLNATDNESKKNDSAGDGVST